MKGDKILDLIFLTINSQVSKVKTGNEFSTSDHKIISFYIYLKIDKENIS